jgi:hypothetical protein
MLRVTDLELQADTVRDRSRRLSALKLVDTPAPKNVAETSTEDVKVEPWDTDTDLSSPVSMPTVNVDLMVPESWATTSH